LLLGGSLPTRGRELLGRSADTPDYVEPGLVLVGPGGDGFGISGEGLKLVEGWSLPIGGTNDYGYHSCFAPLVPLDRLADLSLKDIIRAHESWADEEEDDIRGSEVLVDGLFPFPPRRYLPVVPLLNESSALESAQPSTQLVKVFLISMGVTAEYL
jgi:hypothetical protein